jgi:AAA domain
LETFEEYMNRIQEGELSEMTRALVVPEKVTITHSTTESFDASQAEANDILSALMSRISRPSDEGVSSYRRILIYGDPGVGKTIFGARSPSPLIIRVDPNGNEALFNHADTRDVPWLEFRSTQQVEGLVSQAKLGNFDWVKTFFVDTFSELHKRDLDAIARAEFEKNPFHPQRTSPYLAIGPDYNQNTEHMRQLASDFMSLNAHLIFSCHVKEETDTNTGRALVRPNLTPKLAQTLNGMFGAVVYISINAEGQRQAQFHPSMGITAKTQYGGLPSVMEDPSFNKMNDLINEFQKKVANESA